jgi:hypothetical protein
MEIQGLAEEIERGEFADWSADNLSKFVNDQDKPWWHSPSLEQLTSEDLRWFAAYSQLKKVVTPLMLLPVDFAVVGSRSALPLALLR